MSFPFKLGKLPKRPDPLKRDLKFSEFIDLEKIDLASIPAEDAVRGPEKYPMFLNDKLGCCTCTGAGHKILDWCTEMGVGCTLTDKDIEAAYIAVSGYDPKTGANDNGAYMVDVLKHWKNVGIGGYKILGWAQVNHTNLLEMNIASHWFRGLYMGADLPIATQNQGTMWDVPLSGFEGAGTPGSWGGHAFGQRGYNVGYDAFVSWSEKVKASRQWTLGYGVEVYAVLPELWATPGYRAPNGFDLERLKAEIVRVGQMAVV